MNFKKAFTFAEMMIVFIIIGTIIALGVSSVKPWEKAYKYSYIRMYNSLSLAIYNHMINTSDDDAFPKNANDLCTALLEYINTSDHAATCGGSTLGNNPKTPADFPDDKVRIWASNGTKIWIGAKNGSGAPFDNMSVTQDDVTDTVKYYIVYVDLNGDRKPNSPVWSRNQMADIVAFAVTDKYTVVPLGYPEVDARYLEAHVVYPTFDATSGEEDTSTYTGDEDVTSDAMTYYEAKVQAYDLNNDGRISPIVGNVLTYDFNALLNNNSPFKVKHTDGSYKNVSKDNYNSHYEAIPHFDENQCNSTGYEEPVCTVKINDYH